MVKGKIIFSSVFTLCILLLSSCTSGINDFEDSQVEVPTVDDAESVPHRCRLLFDVTMESYSDNSETRADEVWKDGDMIFLTFPEELSNSYGEARFKDGEWNITYYGSLTEGGRHSCKAVYFDNPVNVSSSVVLLSELTGVYEASDASYMFSGGVLSVIADLHPATGRIRFVGEDGDEIALYGISHYSSYDTLTGRFASSEAGLHSKVEAGSTPYIYGFFIDAETPVLNIITSTSAFTRKLSSSIFRAGESGYMNIPTDEAHNGWENRVRFYIKGVELTMLPVSYSTGNFLLAETETTEQLYAAVIDDTSSPSLYPKYGITYAVWENFLSRLNTIMSLNFRIPTREEWQYAYSGGRETQGFSYSGSDILSEVGWFKGNSGGFTHPVKQLRPNELGFYDMSGNVCELVKTGSGTASENYGWFGGYWNAEEKRCTMNYGFDFDYPEFGGLRIALSF